MAISQDTSAVMIILMIRQNTEKDCCFRTQNKTLLVVCCVAPFHCHSLALLTHYVWFVVHLTFCDLTYPHYWGRLSTLELMLPSRQLTILENRGKMIYLDFMREKLSDGIQQWHQPLYGLGCPCRQLLLLLSVKVVVATYNGMMSLHRQVRIFAIITTWW